MSKSFGLPYQGSKNKIAQQIIAQLPKAEYFVDLFAGGCAMTHCAMESGKMLIPKDIWERILKVKSHSINPYSVYNAVVEEAKKYGVSPSIASWRYKYQTNIYNIRGYKSPKIH